MPISTADSAADGRMKVSTTTKAPKKIILKKLIKKYK